MNEIIIDTKGRIAVPLSIRKKWGTKKVWSFDLRSGMRNLY